ncbi:unnamed protein product [Leptosia nina]|uniref:Uncharacterized protein n=1 Tax=Leptosia nina TaxID=320188 RepID=A0AAV1JDL0_9NEOP
MAVNKIANVINAESKMLRYRRVRFHRTKDAWQTLEERPYRPMRGDLHYHAKRHMLPREVEAKRRSTSQRPKELRKKPSGHLKPLNEDDMENDEVVSVAVGPPAIRPKYDKMQKYLLKTAPSANNVVENTAGTNLVKNVLTQLGREFLTHQVSEDFVFGQYVGNSMRNLTSELKLKMQHEILELIVKYQNGKKAEKTPSTTSTPQPEDKLSNTIFKDVKEMKDIKENDKKSETDEGWPDFSNLAKIVGK